MQAKLVKETDKSFVVNAGGKDVTMAKTPGNAKLLEMLKKGGERQGKKDVFQGKGEIPGKAKVKGDSVENDVVHILASPGEIMIPRSASGSRAAAVAFIDKMFSEEANTPGDGKYAQGGPIGHSDEVEGDTPEARSAERRTPEESTSTEDPQDREQDKEKEKEGLGSRIGKGFARMSEGFSGLANSGPRRMANGGRITREMLDDGNDKEPDDDADDDEGDTEVAQAVPMAAKGGRVTKKGMDCYKDGGRVSKDKENLDEWGNIASDVGGAIATGAGAVADAVAPAVDYVAENTHSPAENMRMMFGKPQAVTPTFDPNNIVAPAELQSYTPPAQSTAPAAGTVQQNVPGREPTDEAAAQQAAGPGMANVTSRKETTSGTQAPYDQAYVKSTKAVQDAIRVEGNLVAASKNEEAAARNLAAQRYDQQVQENQRVAAREQLRVQDQLKKSEDVRQKYLNMKVDPNHLWGDQGTGNRVLAGLGLMLGGFGQAFNGKQNPALDIINTALERDLEIQKSQIAKAKGDVDIQDSLFRQYQDVYKDNRAAEAATLASMQDRVKMQLETMAAKAGSEQAKAIATTAAAKIGNEADANRAKANTYMVTKETEQKPVKQLPLASGDIEKKIIGIDNASSELRRIRAAYDGIKDKTGPIKTRLNDMLRAIGADDSDVSTLRSRIINTLAAKTNLLSGTGAAEKEAARLEKTLPILTDNPETFFKVLDAEVARMQDERTGIEYAAEGRYSLPNKPVDPNAGVNFKAR